MKKIVAVFAAAVLAFALLAGCATTFKTTNGKLAYGDVKGTAKGSFEAQKSYLYIINPALLSLSKPYAQLDKMIEPAVQAKGGNAATNVEITNGFDTLGFFVTYLTGGILGMNYVKVTGTAVSQ